MSVGARLSITDDTSNVKKWGFKLLCRLYMQHVKKRGQEWIQRRGPSTSGFLETTSDIRSPRLWNDGEFSYTFCEVKEKVSVFRDTSPCSPSKLQHTGLPYFYMVRRAGAVWEGMRGEFGWSLERRDAFGVSKKTALRESGAMPKSMVGL
jgi:hypothetical protein